MRVAENLLMAAALVALNAWCAAWAFAFLRVYQLAGLEADTTAGRTLAAVAALGGVAFGIWTLYRGWRMWRKR